MKRIVLLLLLVFPSLARAEQVGVVVSGEPTMQPLLVKQLEGWLKKHGHDLVSVPLPSDAINTLIDCFVIEDESCARGVIDKRGRSKVIVYARVDVQAGGDIEKTVTVTAYWFEKGQKAVSARKFCERCTEDTLKTTADELMASLAKAAPQSTGKIKVTSNPPGASCSIDGKATGNTPVDQDLAPGPHEITIQRERHEVATRKVTVAAGEVTNVDVALVEITQAKSKLPPTLVMAAGGAAIVTGIVMLAIDEDKGRDQPLFIRNTGPSGAIIAVSGVAIAAGGFVWYRMTGSTSESHPVAAATGGGGYIGWSGRF